MYPVVIPTGTERAPRSEKDLEFKEGYRGERCKHLRGKVPGKFRCALHNKRWYRETPCYHHGQIEQRDTPCRMGTRVIIDKTWWWFLTKEESTHASKDF